MVGIVVVSHSPALASAAVTLALQMVPGSALRIEIAAGAEGDRLGTDAARVAEAIVAADDGAGVAVIMDLGSAILSAELAVELLPDPNIETRLVSAATVISAGTIARKAMIINPDGIHARPAALIAGALASLDARVMIATERSAAVSARSPTALMSLGTRADDVLRIEADGAGAAEAVDRIVALVRDGFGEMSAEPVEAPGAEEAAFSSDPIGVSPGRVVGPALRMPDPITEPDPTASP